MPLHPVIAAVVEKLQAAPAFSDGTPEDARRMVAAGRAALGDGAEVDSVSDLSIRGRGGDIRARVFRPAETSRGVIVFYHGGGWVVGAIEDFDVYARGLAIASGCTVVLPDYRLAPEHPFPAGLEDAEDVLVWAHANRSAVAGRDVPLVVAGDSAGGNLAAVVTRRMKGKVPIAMQVLYYPVTDSDFSRQSYRDHGEGLPLKTRDMEWFFGHYAPESRWTDPDISPLRASDHSGLPPAVVVMAEYDVLRDEGEAYARRLTDAGVPVTARVLPGMTHGFIRLHNLVEPSQQELERIGREVSLALGN